MRFSNLKSAVRKMNFLRRRWNFLMPEGTVSTSNSGWDLAPSNDQPFMFDGPESVLYPERAIEKPIVTRSGPERYPESQSEQLIMTWFKRLDVMWDIENPNCRWVRARTAGDKGAPLEQCWRIYQYTFVDFRSHIRISVWMSSLS
jgi:hypothetical protein